MPKKPIDEDRARRKELLEQKKAAKKKAALEAAERLAQQEKEAAAKAQVQIDHTSNNGVEVTTTMNNNNGAYPSAALSLLQLPVDALHVIYSMLPVADLGRMVLTMNIQCCQLVVSSRTTYLLSRLQHTTTNQQHQQQQLHLCTSEKDVQVLLNDTWKAHIKDRDPLVNNKKRLYRNKVIQDMMDQVQQFLSYVRFIEEAVTGYSTIRSRDTKQNAISIQLPKFVQGRIVSISPEHSIVRVGGDMTHCGPCSGVTSWGVGKRGQLGHNKRKDERYPLRLRYGIGYKSPDLRIVQVSAGGGLVRVAHTLLLTSTGRVLSFGTGQYGALGHGYNAAKQLPDALKPTYITALSHVICTCVAAGELHSAVVTSDGDVYTWGDGFCGQLGHGDKRPATTPTQVTSGGLNDECVASISCGSRHTLAITEDGECYSWGLGHFGVLGRSYTPFEYDADTSVHAFATMAGDHVDHAVDPPFPLPDVPTNENNLLESTNPNVVEVTQQEYRPVRDTVAELAAHLDLIANLTLDDSSDQCIPKIVDTLHGIVLVSVSAGHRHSLFLDVNGYLYSCGAGSSGCLGHGNTETCKYPCRIAAMYDDENTDILFRQMSAGVDISMAVSTMGNVYGWGKTEGGRLGLGMAKSQVNAPRRIYLNDTIQKADSITTENDSVIYKAVDVDCGYVHSVVVALNGTTFICGGVGVEGEDDGQQQQESQEQGDHDGNHIDQNNIVHTSIDGRPKEIADVNIWTRLPEPKDEVIKKERWQKLGKYEVKGRSKMT